MKLLVATKNRNKIKEFNRVVGDLFEGVELQSLTQLTRPVPDVIEDRETFEGNAIKKAVELCEFSGCSVMSEDSGLEVDALGGAPGVYSARYAGAELRSDQANNQKLVEELQAHSPPYTARYVAVTCLALRGDDEMGAQLIARLGIQDVPDGEPSGEGLPGKVGDYVVIWWRGECEGEIVLEGRGSGGFGYDPHFFSPTLGKTLAEVSLEEKSAISHRRAALEKLRRAMV